MMYFALSVAFMFSLYFVLALAIRLYYGVIAAYDLSMAAAIPVYGYLFMSFYKDVGLGIVISFVASAFCVVLMYLALNIFFYERFRRSSVYVPWKMLVASLGVYMIIVNLVSLAWRDEKKILHFDSIRSVDIVDVEVTGLYLLAYTFFVIVSLSAYYLVKYTNLGREIKAVSSNPFMSDLLGIDNYAIKMIAIVIAFFYLSFASLIILMDYGIKSTSGFHYLLYGIVVYVVASRYKISSLLYSSLFLSVLGSAVRYYLDAKWSETIIYAFLLIALFAKPYSLRSFFRFQKLKNVSV